MYKVKYLYNNRRVSHKIYVTMCLEKSHQFILEVTCTSHIYYTLKNNQRK